MTYKKLHSRIIPLPGIVLAVILLCLASPLAAQSQSVAAFPHSASWGDIPAEVAAAKGPPLNPLEGENFAYYTYPFDLYGAQGETLYIFDENGLYVALYIFPTQEAAQKAPLFDRLEPALTALFNTPGDQRELAKNGVTAWLTFWENDETFCHLSSFSTFPEVEVKFLDKKNPDNQAMIDIMRKIRNSPKTERK